MKDYHKMAIRAFVSHLRAFVAHLRAFVAIPRPFVAHLRVFVAIPRPFVAHIRAFVAHICAFMAIPRPFVAHLRAFVAIPRPFVAHLRVFVAHLRVFVAIPRPFVAHIRVFVAIPRPFVANIRWQVYGFIMYIVFISGCQQKETNTFISGTLSNSQNFKLRLLEMDTKSLIPVDSILVGQDGQFDFNLKLKETGFWILQAESGKILALVVHPGDQVNISGSAISYPDNLAVKGNEESVILHEFYKQTWQEEKRVDSIEEVIAAHQEDADYYPVTQKMDTLLKLIWERQRDREIRFISKNTGYLSSLLVLNYAFGMNPVLDPREDFCYYRMLDSALMLKYPRNKHVLYHHDRVTEHGIDNQNMIKY